MAVSDIDQDAEDAMRRWTVERRLLPVEPERLTSLFVYRMGWVRAELPAGGPVPWVDLEVRVEPGPGASAWLLVIGAYAVPRDPAGRAVDAMPMRTPAQAKVRAVADELAAEALAVLAPLPGVPPVAASERGPLLVRDVMDPDCPVVDDDLPVEEAGALLAAEQTDGAPVVDRTGRLLGVITERDLLAALVWDLGEIAAAPRQLDMSAGAVCSRPAVVTAPGVTLARAAQQMLFHGVRRLAVVEHGRLVGMVTRQALFAALRGDLARTAAGTSAA